MAVNKVDLADGTTLIDITDTTAEAADVAAVKVFYTEKDFASVTVTFSGSAMASAQLSFTTRSVSVVP